MMFLKFLLAFVGGNNLESAFENIVPCMFNYMTDISKVTCSPNNSLQISVEGINFERLPIVYCHLYIM